MFCDSLSLCKPPIVVLWNAKFSRFIRISLAFPSGISSGASYDSYSFGTGGMLSKGISPATPFDSSTFGTGGVWRIFLNHILNLIIYTKNV